MDEKQFALLLGQIGDLSPVQFRQLAKTYAGKTGQDAKRVWEQSVYAVSEQHLADLGINRACPGCGSSTVVHNGLTDAGIQRFQCQDCGKNFTRFTGTLLEKSRLPWEVWVEVLKMVLNDDSLKSIQTVLEQDFDSKGINIKTVFAMRMKLIHAMATIEPPKLTGVIQMDESFIRESQKGRNLELINYMKGMERFPRYGRKPSKYGTMGPEFATILTAIDSRGYCVCKVVALGRTTPDAVIDLYEQHCLDAAYLCSDANAIYQDACDLLDIAHYVKPSSYTTVIERAGYLYPESGKPSEERQAHNRALLERLYREGQIDYIAHREDLTYGEFDHIKRSYRLSLARVNELHAEIKLDLPKPSGRAVQILKEKTEKARKVTRNKYFKYSPEDIPSFNTREILLDAPRSHLTEIAKAHKIKGHTKMTQWGIAAAIATLDDIDEIIVELVTKNRAYMIDEEDVKYLQSLQFRVRD